MYQDLPSADPAKLQISTRVAKQILCLTICLEILKEEQDKSYELIRNNLSK
jgi:hypothetical protein